MRKLFLICLFLVACSLLFTVQQGKTEELTNEDLIQTGFSDYMAQMVILQKDKHEGLPYKRPDKIKEYLRSVLLDTDLAIPSQSFGYYNISPAE